MFLSDVSKGAFFGGRKKKRGHGSLLGDERVSTEGLRTDVQELQLNLSDVTKNFC